MRISGFFGQALAAALGGAPDLLRARAPLCLLLGALAAAVAVGASPRALGDEVTMQSPASLIEFARLSIAPLLGQGVELKLYSEGGSSQAIAAVGSTSMHIGVIGRALTSEDRAGFPARRFQETPIGFQVFAFGVARDVWDSGVHALSQKQLLEIYEGRLRNWKELGGANTPIKFFNPKQGQGAWEEMAKWLYGDLRKAPLGKFDQVATAADARDSVEFNPGSISLIPPALIDGKGVFALGILLENGEVIPPLLADVQAGKYPLARPVSLLAGDRPAGAVRKVFEFFASPPGQALVKQASLMPLLP